MKQSFRTYKGYGGKITPFTIFLIHGREDRLMRLIQTFIETTVSFKTIVLKDEASGKTIIEKLQEKIWEHTDCAVAIMSGEDKTINDVVNARPNVLFEIGYCLGYFDQLYVEDYKNDIRPVIMVKENSTSMPSDLYGIEYIEYDKNIYETNQLPEYISRAISQRLEYLFSEIKNYYK